MGSLHVGMYVVLPYIHSLASPQTMIRFFVSLFVDACTIFGLYKHSITGVVYMTQDYNAISIEFLRIIIVRCLHRYNNEKNM